MESYRSYQQMNNMRRPHPMNCNKSGIDMNQRMYHNHQNGNCNSTQSGNNSGCQDNCGSSKLDDMINTINCAINANQSCNDNRDMDCDKDCNENMPGMMGMPLANAYVPIQDWCKLYSQQEAMCQGTAFPELNLIFCGGRGRK